MRDSPITEINQMVKLLGGIVSPEERDIIVRFIQRPDPSMVTRRRLAEIRRPPATIR